MKYLLVFVLTLSAFCLDFSVISKGKNYDDNNTVLIFGGIQGDEPGGFHAASLLISDYKITKGRLLIAPNLAFKSIIARSRGTHGDLNRKFAKLSKKDPDYATIQRIKRLILRKDVSMIINLHDGSGYYSPVFISQMNNPARWGNSAIIDQKSLENAKYKELEKIASQTVANINKTLVSKHHKYHLKNTKTLQDNDKEMLKALTFFATKNNKSSFANEASKNLPTHLRVYYHLLAIESYLKVAGVHFKRDFPLTPAGVKAAINKPIYIELFKNSLIYLDKSREVLRYVPFPVNEPMTYRASNELSAIMPQKSSFYIQYGNRFKMRLYPQYFYFKNTQSGAKIRLDGKIIDAKFASLLKVKKSFFIPPIKGVRINVIGLTKGKDESGIKINLNMLKKRYSMDKAGKIYRVEFYLLKDAAAKYEAAPRPFTTGIIAMSGASLKAQKMGIKNISEKEVKKELEKAGFGPNQLALKEHDKSLSKEDLQDRVYEQSGFYGTPRTISKTLPKSAILKAKKQDFFLGMMLVEFE